MQFNIKSSKSFKIELGKKIGLLLFLLVVFWLMIPQTSQAVAPAVGAVNHLFDIDSSETEIEVIMTPLYGEAGYHFYALSSLFKGVDSGWYTGIQTNGIYNDRVLGNMFIFSVWNADTAYPAAGVLSTPFAGEGQGYSLRKPYDWEIGKSYRITVRRGEFESANNAYRWGAAITDLSSGRTFEIGEILGPEDAHYLHHGSLFHERFSGAPIDCKSIPQNLEKVGVRFSQLESGHDLLIKASEANGIFAQPECRQLFEFSSNESQAQNHFGSDSIMLSNPESEPESTNNGGNVSREENNDSSEKKNEKSGSAGQGKSNDKDITETVKRFTFPIIIITAISAVAVIVTIVIAIRGKPKRF